MQCSFSTINTLYYFVTSINCTVRSFAKSMQTNGVFNSTKLSEQNFIPEKLGPSLFSSWFRTFECFVSILILLSFKTNFSEHTDSSAMLPNRNTKARFVTTTKIISNKFPPFWLKLTRMSVHIGIKAIKTTSTNVS